MFSNSNFFLGANQHICIYGLHKNSIDQIIFSFYQNRIMFGLKKLNGNEMNPQLGTTFPDRPMFQIVIAPPLNPNLTTTTTPPPPKSAAARSSSWEDPLGALQSLFFSPLPNLFAKQTPQQQLRNLRPPVVQRRLELPQKEQSSNGDPWYITAPNSAKRLA